MKKALLYCLICTFLFSFTACQDLQEEAAADKESDEYVLDFFVPEDTEVIIHIDNLLVLNGTLPFSELIAFYENAFQRLMDAHETEIDDTQDGIWIFSGIYNGIHIHQRASGVDLSDNQARPFIVELRDNGESVNIEIIY